MAANRIKGITVEISGDTTKLTDALKGVNGEIRSTQSQLKDIDKLLKLDPGNTELIAQKHRVLGEAVEATKQKLETLRTAQEQATQALSQGTITQEQYDALQREIIETTEELRHLEEQARQSGEAVQSIAAKGEKLKDIGGKISGVGKGFLPVTAGVAALGTAAVKTAADFDSGMSKVASISGATGTQLTALRDKAREMGAKTKFSASEAAAAMEYMAMAGWKTDEMLGGIEGVMNLAAASGEDLATTSDIVTDALTAFGLSATDSGHFADILAAASSNANTNVSMMGETFKYAAPVAGALGFSAEDTAVAIGLMGNAGIKASQAGTSLRTIMNTLSGDVTICGENIGKVSIQTINADGTMRSLSDILADCRLAFSGLTESESAAAAETLVGKNAMSGFLALMNAGDKDIDKLTNAIANCDGVSGKMSGTMQDNLTGSLTVLKSQLEELSISFGAMIMPIVKEVVSFIQGIVDKLNHMDEGTRRFILTIAAVVAAVGPVLIAVGKVITAVGTIMSLAPKISAAITTVKTAMAALHTTMLANPIFLIIAAITALVAAFIYFWNTSEGFRQFWIDLWEGIKEIAVAVWDAITGFLSDAWNAIKGVAEGIWNGVKDFFSGLWSGISSTATSTWDSITGFLSDAWSGISSTAQTIWNGVSGFFSGLWEDISSGASTAWDGIKSGLSSAWDAISGTASDVWNSISGTVTGVTEGISTALQGKWDKMKSSYYEHGGGMTGLASAAMETIQDCYTAGWEAVNKITGGKLDAVKDKVTQVAGTIKSWLSETWSNISSTAENAWTSISGFFSNTWTNIKSTFSSAANSVSGFVSTSWNHISTATSNTFSNIQSGISTAWSNIKSSVSTSMQNISSTVSTMWSNIRTGISNSLSNIKTSIQNGFNSAVNFIKNLGTQAYTWGRDIIMGIVNGIKSAINTVVDAVKGVANTISSWLHFSVPDVGPLTDYESWMPDFMNGLARGIERSRGLIQDAMGDVAGDMTLSPSITGTSEALLTPSQGGGRDGALLSMLGQYLPYLPQLANMKVVTDTGTLVGELAPQIDTQLGVMALRQRRQ